MSSSKNLAKSHPISYDINQDGEAFRHAAFQHFGKTYSPQVREALAVLHGGELHKQYPIESLWKIHVAQVKPEYLFRHSLPFLIVEDSFFGDEKGKAAPYLAALLLGYTLVLGQLDYFFDGNEPVIGRGNAPLKLDQADTAAFCTKSIYAAIGLLLDLKNGEIVARDALLPFGNFVVSRLYQDYLEKFRREVLKTPPSVDEYLNSPISSLRASSYWEVMLRGSFARHNQQPPKALVDACDRLRALRQVVDEIADLCDDVLEGSLTLPVLLILHDSRYQKNASKLIQQAWDKTSDLASRKEAVARLHDLIVGAGIFAHVYTIAETMWREGREYCRTIEKEKGRAFTLLLDIKMAKLVAMSRNGWQDIQTKNYFQT